MGKKALIVGVSSQDGSYLAEFLLDKGYEVIGTIRHSTNFYQENISHLYGKIAIRAADVIDGESIADVVKHYKPDEVYNMAAQSIPADSWTHPFYTGEVTALGPVRVLEAIKHHAPNARFYQATSREIYGNVSGTITEEAAYDANNPYGIAKAYAHMMTRCYRESFGIFACGGILFNHESPRRSLHFVTRKISAGVACIKNKVKNPPLNELGEPLIKNGKLHMGDLDSMRDWGYAKEYVEAMWLMLQHEKPQDYVIGTNTSYAVREACRLAFAHVGLSWEDYVVSDKRLFRPTEIKHLKGDYTKAKKELGWEPKTYLEDLMNLMVDADLERFT
ncbi:MAG TPA: GDP-mannose 4,6-dehydratase [Patescibacteria group bacterium]|nr:GDP-mannose 4,6-dehydratase [Patescibacteria group bacterium]